jgi:diacylglycerol kinase family enzyme
MRPAPIPVVINRSGGTAARLGDGLERTVRDAFAARRVGIDLHLVDGKDLADTVNRFRRRSVVAVGGGDGSISSAAAVLAGSDTALAVLPLGTLNHFAHQLGVPDSLEEAAAVAAGGHALRIDLARVGERIFINNASLGIYPAIVRRRDASRLPKRLAQLPAAWNALRRGRGEWFELAIGDDRHRVETPLLFVGNNRYDMAQGAAGVRDSLTDGLLSLVAVAPRRPLALLGFGVRAALGQADLARDFCEVADVAKFELLGTGAVDVAHDGEVTRMDLPLRFEILPRALTVMAGDDAPNGRNVLVPRRTLA